MKAKPDSKVKTDTTRTNAGRRSVALGQKSTRTPKIHATLMMRVITQIMRELNQAGKYQEKTFPVILLVPSAYPKAMIAGVNTYKNK
jgi:hypothetical protein